LTLLATWIFQRFVLKSEVKENSNLGG
jgi:hypothetical protein